MLAFAYRQTEEGLWEVRQVFKVDDGFNTSDPVIEVECPPPHKTWSHYRPATITQEQLDLLRTHINVVAQHVSLPWSEAPDLSEELMKAWWAFKWLFEATTPGIYLSTERCWPVPAGIRERSEHREPIRPHTDALLKGCSSIARLPIPISLAKATRMIAAT